MVDTALPLASTSVTVSVPLIPKRKLFARLVLLLWHSSRKAPAGIVLPAGKVSVSALLTPLLS